MARVAAPPAGADESLYFALEHRGSGRASGTSRRKDRARNPEAAKKALVISLSGQRAEEFARREEQRLQYERERLAECTFTPHINKPTRSAGSRRH